MSTANPAWVVPDPAEPMGPGPAPTFSVVIPAYQAADVVGTAVHSALEQTVRPLEVLVVDDGSTDDLAGALAPFGDSVRLVSIPHGGEAAARNAGIDAAVGSHVAFLDADDRYEPGFLAAIGELLSARPDLDIATADPVFTTPAGVDGTFYGRNPFPVVEQRSAILRSCFLTTLSVVRTSRLRDIGGYDESLVHAADWDVWIRLLNSGSAAGLVRAPLTRYSIHAGQASQQRARSLQARVAVLEKALRSGALGPGEIAIATSALDAARSRAALAAAASGGRAGWARLATAAGATWRHRALGVLGSVAPSAAARRVGAVVQPAVSAAEPAPR